MRPEAPEDCDGVFNPGDLESSRVNLHMFAEWKKQTWEDNNLIHLSKRNIKQKHSLPSQQTSIQDHTHQAYGTQVPFFGVLSVLASGASIFFLAFVQGLQL